MAKHIFSEYCEFTVCYFTDLKCFFVVFDYCLHVTNWLSYSYHVYRDNEKVGVSIVHVLR